MEIFGFRFSRSVPHLMAIAITTALLAACQCGVPTPKDPHWGKDTCAFCRMAVSEQQFATQIVGPGYTVRHYDDLGCALKDISQGNGAESGTLYIKAKDTAKWLPANDARYIGGQRTPMNYGYAAVEEGGELSFAEVKAAIINGPSSDKEEH